MPTVPEILTPKRGELHFPYRVQFRHMIAYLCAISSELWEPTNIVYAYEPSGLEARSATGVKHVGEIRGLDDEVHWTLALGYKPIKIMDIIRPMSPSLIESMSHTHPNFQFLAKDIEYLILPLEMVAAELKKTGQDWTYLPKTDEDVYYKCRNCGEPRRYRPPKTPMKCPASPEKCSWQRIHGYWYSREE